jgi:hypothetical protein
LDNYDKKLLITDKYEYEVARNDDIGADNLTLKVESERGFRQLSKDLETLREQYTTLNDKSIPDLTTEEVLDVYSTVKSIGNNFVSW